MKTIHKFLWVYILTYTGHCLSDDWKRYCDMFESAYFGHLEAGWLKKYYPKDRVFLKTLCKKHR